MKKIILGSFLAMMILATGCSKTDTRLITNKKVFAMKDIIGDDNGNGNYEYPTSKMIKKGDLDIKEFEILENKENYIFKITIKNRVTNLDDNFRNWDNQMFDIYIQYADGFHNQAIAGRNVKFSQKWDKVVLIAPERVNRLYRSIYKENREISDDKTEYDNLTQDVIIPQEQYAKKRVFTAVLPKKAIRYNKIKKVALLSLGFTREFVEGNSYNRVVNRYRSQESFGGGTNYLGDSNVIDLLGDNSTLKNFKSFEGITEFATIDMIDITK